MGRDPGPRAGGILHATADALESAREEIEWWLVHEGGGVPQKAAFEVGEAEKELREAAASDRHARSARCSRTSRAGSAWRSGSRSGSSA